MQNCMSCFMKLNCPCLMGGDLVSENDDEPDLGRKVHSFRSGHHTYSSDWATSRGSWSVQDGGWQKGKEKFKYVKKGYGTKKEVKSEK